MNVFELRVKVERRRGELAKMVVTPGFKTLEDYQRALAKIQALDEVMEMTRERGNESGKDKDRTAA